MAFYNTFYFVYSHEQINIYSAFQRPGTESHMAQSNIKYLGASESWKRNTIKLKMFIKDDWPGHY